MAGGKRIKWTFEMCAKYVSEETDCTLLSTEYVPASKGKMVFTCCTCGKPVEWTWSNFYNRGVRSCKKCANHRRVKTTGQFINEIYASYGSSITVLGVYQGTMNPIRCRCNVCGFSDWFPTPHTLLHNGGGCPKCAEKSKQKWAENEVVAVSNGNAILLSVYAGAKEKLTCKCVICGYQEWRVSLDDLRRGRTCPCCTKGYHWNIELCKYWASHHTEAKLLSSNYVNLYTPMQFECSCGMVFSASWHQFSAGEIQCCSLCSGNYYCWTTSHCKQWALRNSHSTLIAGEYSGVESVLLFRCQCGRQFERSWKSFRDGTGLCPKCIQHKFSFPKTQNEFEVEVADVHGSNVTVIGKYQNAKTHIRCKCNICGQDKWLIRPDKLLGGGKCPNCNNKTYRGEAALRDLVQSLQVPFKEQFTFPDCIGSKGGVCRFDCAVLDISDQSPLLLIEYDGEQHFKPVEFFGGQQAFEYRQANDRIKDSYCKDHGIPLLRISYKQFDQIEQLVTDKLYELNILQKEAD